jgi:hypothetical protein
MHAGSCLTALANSALKRSNNATHSCLALAIACNRATGNRLDSDADISLSLCMMQDISAAGVRGQVQSGAMSSVMRATVGFGP